MMNPNVYRMCAVPQCGNTSKKTPNKLFIHVPKKKNIRNTWLELARRDPTTISPNYKLYFCEDHFDLPNDMENYVKYCVMGAASQVRMKPGCIPRKYECQPDRRKRTSNTTQRPYAIKKQRRALIEECEQDLIEATSTKQLETIGISLKSSGQQKRMLRMEKQSEDSSSNNMENTIDDCDNKKKRLVPKKEVSSSADEDMKELKCYIEVKIEPCEISEPQQQETTIFTETKCMSTGHKLVEIKVEPMDEVPAPEENSVTLASTIPKKTMQKEHTGTTKKTHSCNVCEYKCKFKSVLLVHMRTHTGEKPFSCHLCQTKCALQSSLTKHMRTHSGETPYSCKLCQQKFKQHSHLYNHMKIHNGERSFSCDICQSKFTKKYHLINHMMIHTGLKPYVCDICHLKFAMKSNLTTHMRTHTGEKPFLCNICHEKFTLKKSLTKHMSLHIGKRPFSCALCPKECSTKYNLSVHMRTHTGEQPYSCGLCQRKFTQKSHLTFHMKDHMRDPK